MKRINILAVLAIPILIFASCNKPEIQVTKEFFQGYAQKGPFINGTSVTIAELDANLKQTGKTYLTTIADNSGSFEQKDIELVSSYVELKADGYYFNEISGSTSVSPITLYAISDISDINSANVNVLTHLEKSRVEYLVKQKGMSFTAAKQQAQGEVLAIFGFTQSQTTSETLDLSSNAELLAISCILQGYLAAGDMMSLMADIITDIKSDGKLDNTALGTKLMNNAYSISSSLTDIRNNLIAKYTELGISVTIPDFENKVIEFIDSGMYPQTLAINYPAEGKYGINILSDELTEIDVPFGMNAHFYGSIRAEVPSGMGLKIVIKNSQGGYDQSTNENWDINWDINGFTFIVEESGKVSDLKFMINYNENMSNFTIEYYENGVLTPTKTKEIKLFSSPQVYYPEADINLLWDGVTSVNMNEEYYLVASVSTGASLKVVLKGGAWSITSESMGFNVSQYDNISHSQEFIANDPNCNIGLKIAEGTYDESTQSYYIIVEIYENGATTPTKNKRLILK
ncbi:hypothetical protein LJC30_03830 [Odoribacter sp. OttesenSCG-928-L07]|nr:hypothetical protein [Odoribacter sp. OttesenSCG-928-L07]